MLNKYKRKYKHATSGVSFIQIKIVFCPQVWNVAKPYIDKYQMEYIPESRPISPTAFSLESPASPRKRCRQEWMVHLFFLALFRISKIFTILLMQMKIYPKLKLIKSVVL